MTAEQFNEIVTKILIDLRLITPYKTGNLCHNGVSIEYVNPDEIRVYVNLDVAFYMVYVNEPWLSPKWHGKKNPNEGWWNKFAEGKIPEIIQAHGGIMI